MAGHSKWAQIKRKKAKVDAERGKIFTKLSREIMVAVRMGGGDPEANPRLRAAIDRAREANIPMENIKRAIQKALGEGAGEKYEEVFYEGYGPGGVALLIRTTTNNRNRTAAEVRHILSKFGGSLGEAGCVSWLFRSQGLITVRKDSGFSEEDLLLLAMEAGANDLQETEDTFEIITAPEDLARVKQKLQEQGVPVEAAELTLLPQTTVPLEGEEAVKVLRLVQALEDLDDVEEVYANFDIPSTLMEEVSARV
ncbi:YebC/PmpR family DNA-binding transcriptional regulator [Ammonifex thiophilus]|uniref:Probable transcriptional regulatory protein DXX99_07290 n=1 Tax=Ammonifex thiophilus TaxID=444093 RepID=A0A3D8P2L1_9THEO|nr:YebC/PmpR family DNA-binding transcriptional regulator [Ammonifex thiophilus]RDV82547.1 YebC/PmpR family DNA-binding transcriptional regulator [Ammonifex thiophilus]